MNPMESWPQSETPKKEDLPPPPIMIEMGIEKAEPPAAITSMEPIAEATSEDAAGLKDVEEKLDEVRQELKIMYDAFSKHQELDRRADVQGAIHRSKQKFLGLFRRKQPSIPGLLSYDQKGGLADALQKTNEQFHELEKQRDELEERLLDVEVLRERRKTRISDEYYQALEESGRHVTHEEKYQAGKGKAHQELIIDGEIEALKKKRVSN